MKPTKPNNVTITIESKTVIRVLALVVVALFAISLLHAIVQPLTLILISGFLALALNPAVSWISGKLKSQSRVRATGAAYVLVISFLVAFFSFVFPPLVAQTVDFIKDVPNTVQDLKDADTPLGGFVERYDLNDEVTQLTDDYGSRFQDLGKPALSTAGKIGTALVSIVTVLVLTFMLLVEGPVWLKRYFDALPSPRRTRHQNLAKRMYKVVVGYVNGQVLIAAMGGFFATTTLFIASQILDVDVNPIALGGIIALFALLPMIGTILGAAIVILACLIVSVPLAIVMAIFFTIYQQIENVTIQPYVQSKSSNLTPLIVFVAAILGVGLGGILGVFLAIPAAGCLKVFIEDYYDHRKSTKVA